jgi:hypothetical protein
LLKPVADTILYTTSILAVYSWFRDMLAIDETKCSAPRYKLMYLRQVVLVSCSGKATRPQRCTLYKAVAEVLVTIPMKQEHHVLPPLCHGEDDVAGGPCIHGSMTLLCSDELEM